MTWQFDGCISQDAFVHAYSKKQAMCESLRVTKGGGFMVVSDLFKGEGQFVSAEEFKTFSSAYMVHDWQTPAQSVETAQQAGWTDVQYFDFTDEIKVSFQKLLKRVTTVVQSGKILNPLNLKPRNLNPHTWIKPCTLHINLKP